MKKLNSNWVWAVVFLAACQPKTPTEQPAEPESAVKPLPEKLVLYQTNQATGDKLALKGEYAFADFGQPTERQPCVFVNPNHRFQQLIGIGGALTDASAEVFARLPAHKQDELLTAYYDSQKGIGYRMARTSIGSSDFSSGSYDYVPEGDSALAHFSVDHDRQYRIPMIKQAMAKAGELKLFASPWSPPAWMKDNNDRLHGGHLLPRYRQAWANHYVKFVQAYQQEGINIWGLTVQNEPMAVQIWESCIFTDTEERDFVKSFLGPTLERAGLKDKKLIVWDHNRDLVFQRASTILDDPDAARYVWGVGYHWYETWVGDAMQFENLKRVKEAFPDVNLIFTEGCAEVFDPARIGRVELGERYGHSMIHDFNAGCVAWTDWNVLLDEQGGPNHVGNFCFSPVHANTQTGELTYTSSFYYIGHFSKFLKPGAYRVSCSSSRVALECTAFENPDGSVVVIVMNAGENELSYHLWIAGKAVSVACPSHAIQTLVF